MWKMLEYEVLRAAVRDHPYKKEMDKVLVMLKARMVVLTEELEVLAIMKGGYQTQGHTLKGGFCPVFKRGVHKHSDPQLIHFVAVQPLIHDVPNS